MLHLDDPVAFWENEGQRQRELIAWLSGRDQVVIQGSVVIQPEMLPPPERADRLQTPSNQKF